MRLSHLSLRVGVIVSTPVRRRHMFLQSTTLEKELVYVQTDSEGKGINILQNQGK